MGKTLYLECYSGISGDMTVAALLDLGAEKDVLQSALESLQVDGCKIQISRVKKSGIDACDFQVILDAAHENHDHDMEYLHGEASISEQQQDEHVHKNHSHENVEPVHSRQHRGLTEIMEIIQSADITERAKEIAVRIFTIIAKAEAKAHAVPMEQVHFHEVGAVDSIVDIVSVAVCMDNLNITEVIVPKLCEGYGTIRCQHGFIPVPAPAVVNIVSAHNLSLEITNVEGELVTPTGAAIVAALQTKNVLPKNYRIKKVGIGAGKRSYNCPGILRAMFIEENVNSDVIYKLETNVDDCCGEALGYVMQRLFEAGAKDVHYTPVFMKKNRPGYQLNIICEEKEIKKLEQIVFEETTTIGIRRVKMERSILKRRNETVHTSLGDAQVKVCELTDGVRKYPEYDSVIEICKKQNMSYQDVYAIVQNESNRLDG